MGYSTRRLIRPAEWAATVRDKVTESVMSKRGVKIAALLLSGGVLLQFVGCASLLAQQLLGTIVSSLLSTLIQSILGTAGSTA